MAKQYKRKNKIGTFYYKDPEKTILHREDGPAIDYEGDGGDGGIWFLNGMVHRIDGPAAEYPNGYKAWWINGEFIFAIKKSEKIIKRIR